MSLGNLWNRTSFLHRKSWNNEPSHQNFSKRIYILVESPISRYFRSSCKLLVLGSSVAACRSLKLQSYPQKSTHHPCVRNPHHLDWVNHSWIPSSIGCISAVDLWRCLGYSGLHPYTFFEGIQYPLSFPVTTFDAVTAPFPAFPMLGPSRLSCPWNPWYLHCTFPNSHLHCSLRADEIKLCTNQSLVIVGTQAISIVT